ncbi:MAG TPA: hypothetical protein VFQ22_06640 [Longimicrobiales bacterium]|nr:hypothetical protein [Longimicrobiales bacterium]
MHERVAGAIPPTERVGPRRLGLGPRPVVRAAFAFSIILHLVALWLYGDWARLPAMLWGDGGASVSVAQGARARGMQVLNLEETDGAVEPDLERERPRTPILTLPQESAPSVSGEELSSSDYSFGSDEAPSVELTRPGVTAAERLRPRPSDRRLWAPLPSALSELTFEQREELAVAGRLEEWYDSIAAAEAERSAFTDWTFADAEGNRWGVADGRLHLGSFSIPFPFTFQPPPGQREYLQQYNEIARQGAQGQIRQTVRDRMEAIRARRDAERARERADSARGPER